MCIDEYQKHPESLSHTGWNCLHVLCKYQPESLDTFVLLINHYSIDPKSVENYGWNCLHFLC